METKSDLTFCYLNYSGSDPDIDFEKDIIIKAYNFNKEFAKIEIPKFSIKLVYSREEFDKLWGSKTADYMSAFAKEDDIVVFSYGAFGKETRWEKEKYYETLVHEINHLFYQELRDDEYDPLWLSEGLATFMQHGKKKFNYKDKLELTEEGIVCNFENMTLESYQIFTMFTEYLILNFKEIKILELIEGLKNGQELNNLLQKIYGQSFKELIKNGNKYHQTS